MVTQKVKTWDLLQGHPIAKELDADTQLALLCEFIDLADELGGMSLTEFIDAYFADDSAAEPAPAVKPEPEPAVKPKTRTRTRKAKAEPKAEPKVEPKAAVEEEDDRPEPSTNGDGAAADAESMPRPASMVGMRVVYRFPGRNVLSNEKGVTRDSGGTVTFVDVEGEPWSNIAREKVYPVDPDNYTTLHIIPREAREITGWLAGTPSKDFPEGALLRSMFVEFEDFPERIAFAIMNGKRPYVDRFVALPEKGFEDDQKPTTRFFGEHCFRIHGMDYVVNVVTP